MIFFLNSGLFHQVLQTGTNPVQPKKPPQFDWRECELLTEMIKGTTKDSKIKKKKSKTHKQTKTNNPYKQTKQKTGV